MIIRLVKMIFQDGVEVVGIVPVTGHDADTLSCTEGAVDIIFSELSEVPDGAPIGVVFNRVRAAVIGQLH